MFTKDDKKFMRLAIIEQEKAYKREEYPVAAALVIDDKLIGIATNSLVTSNKGITHAEMNLITKYSSIITEAKKERKVITLYTTLEPCLMCLGTSVLHRISRIVYAYVDPDGGATNIFKKKLPGYYARHWPIIEGGLYSKESQKFVLLFLKKQSSVGWKNVLKEHLKLKDN
ncbi:MAG: nucleoside deaminase [Candidatus Woesearchaeota archaeon]